MLDRAGVRDGMRCCDLGCGFGIVSFMLAERVAPSGRVDGIDMDETRLDLARRDAAERGLTNVTFLVSDVTDWPAPNAYDVVYSRLLLQHLKQPLDLLGRMWQAVRPGGALVVEDADFSLAFCEPPLAAFDFFIEAYEKTLERRGGDPLIGRKLHRYAIEAGVPAPEVTMTQHVAATGEGKSMMHRTLEATAEAIVAEGVAPQGAIEEAAGALAAATADSATIIGGPPTFQILARKD